MRLIEKDCVVG